MCSRIQLCFWYSLLMPGPSMQAWAFMMHALACAGLQARPERHRSDSANHRERSNTPRGALPISPRPSKRRLHAPAPTSRSTEDLQLQYLDLKSQVTVTHNPSQICEFAGDTRRPVGPIASMWLYRKHACASLTKLSALLAFDQQTLLFQRG